MHPAVPAGSRICRDIFGGRFGPSRLNSFTSVVPSRFWWTEAYQQLAAMANVHSYPLNQMNNLYTLHFNTGYADNISQPKLVKTTKPDF